MYIYIYRKNEYLVYQSHKYSYNCAIRRVDLVDRAGRIGRTEEHVNDRFTLCDFDHFCKIRESIRIIQARESV